MEIPSPFPPCLERVFFFPNFSKKGPFNKKKKMKRVRNIKNPSPAVLAVSEGRPPPSCAVVGESELRRIHEIVHQKAATDAKTQSDRREELRKISEARVSHWPNTIEAQRMRKERSRKERLEKEEERRMIIDQEEAALAAAKKNQAIRKANLQLYEQNDRIKDFTSKLFLTTVLEEREKQIAIKEEKTKQLKEMEKQWAQVEEEQLRKAEEEEVKKLKNIKDRTFSLKQAQLDQLEEIRKIKIAERDRSMAEGQEIKRNAEEAVKEEQELEARRREQQRIRAKELVDANTSQRMLIAERKRKEEEEDKLVAEFAAQKEAQMLERKKRMDEKFAAKLATRQELIDRQSHALEQMQAAREEREMKALRDFDRERREREEREEAYRRRRQKEIEDHRQRDMARKMIEDEKEQKARQRMIDIWRERADLLVEEELDERRQQREAAEKLQRFQLLQAQEKKMQELHEKRAEIEEGIFLQEALKEEHDTFNSYVNAVMGEYVSKGREASVIQNAAKRSKLKSV